MEGCRGEPRMDLSPGSAYACAIAAVVLSLTLSLTLTLTQAPHTPAP